MEEKKATVDIIVIMDESGSMYSMGKEPVEAMNIFVNEQKETCADEAKVTLVTFNNTVRTIMKDCSLKEFPGIDEKDYKPCGMTALNDAIGMSIQEKIDSGTTNEVVVIIFTDGHENSSQYYGRKDVQKLIKKVEKERNWKIIFCGANIDTVAEGADLNISLNRCVNFEQTPGLQGAPTLPILSRTISETVSDYRSRRSDGKVEDLRIQIPNDPSINHPFPGPPLPLGPLQLSRENTVHHSPPELPTLSRTNK